MSQVTLGGERLGSGNKTKVNLHNYNRSTHDLSYVWRSTMAPGTLVPFMTEVALPGDTFDIDLDVDVLTSPTTGPLFGSFKVQLDVFAVPFRLYISQLHMNMLNIGRDMSKILLPQIYIEADPISVTDNLDNAQVNPSCLLSYLGIRGLGESVETPKVNIARTFNGLSYLAYWDIYKQYYANKQEEIGAMIHKEIVRPTTVLTSVTIPVATPPIATTIPIAPVTPPTDVIYSTLVKSSKLVIAATGLTYQFDPSQLVFNVAVLGESGLRDMQATEIFTQWEIYPDSGIAVGFSPTQFALDRVMGWNTVRYYNPLVANNYDSEPEILTFPLKNIDDMRMSCLQYAPAEPTDAFSWGAWSPDPYGTPLKADNSTPRFHSKQFALEGLALKTYQSDQFQNWISTEWIDGTDGVSAITAVDTTGNSFTIDELQLSKKVYDMLNRIAISGGTYDDWLDAVYTHERKRGTENPAYLGGLIRSVVFEEVVSTATTEGKPLGSLAGRGRIGGKNKGGKVTAKVDEPSYIIGIVSITPNIDYSQGNRWDVNLKTMNDLHKPALDQIGFQNLLTDQIAWYDTKVEMTPDVKVTRYRTVGKQPAWLNYMTNVNRCYGNFADRDNQMWMTLNRRYETAYNATDGFHIKDMTTYIDPSKFNHVFADTKRDAQNFWTQIAVHNTARRKMSAKIMPNL